MALGDEELLPGVVVEQRLVPVHRHLGRGGDELRGRLAQVHHRRLQVFKKHLFIKTSNYHVNFVREIRQFFEKFS